MSSISPISRLSDAEITETAVLLNLALIEQADKEDVIYVVASDTVSAQDSATVERRNASQHPKPEPIEVASVYRASGTAAVYEKFNSFSTRSLDRVIADAKRQGLIPLRGSPST